MENAVVPGSEVANFHSNKPSSDLPYTPPREKKTHFRQRCNLISIEHDECTWNVKGWINAGKTNVYFIGKFMLTSFSIFLHFFLEGNVNDSGDHTLKLAVCRWKKPHSTSVSPSSETPSQTNWLKFSLSFFRLFGNWNFFFIHANDFSKISHWIIIHAP